MDSKLFLFALAAIIAVFFSYRQGIKDGTSLAKRGGVDDGDAAHNKSIFRQRVLKESDEDRKNRIALENIENFGTSIAQKEVK